MAQENLPAQVIARLGEDDTAEFSFPALAGFALRQIRILTLVPFFCAVLAMILGLLFGRDYTAISQFVPEAGASSALGRYASLAASAGISLPSMTTGSSPEFYAALIRSPAMLRQLAETRFTFEDGDDTISATYVEISEIDGGTPQRTMIKVIKQLGDNVQVTTDALSGLVEVRTTAPWIPLAEQMNRRLLQLVAEFNDGRRQSIASAERTFVEGRMSAMSGEVRSAEDSVRNFLERNRGYQNSPQLMLIQDRLRRELELRQGVYSGLAQALESARIEEVRNTPQITMVTQPEGTADRPRLLKFILIGGLLGSMLAVVIAVVKEWLSRDVGRRPDDYSALRTIHWKDLYAMVVGRREKKEQA